MPVLRRFLFPAFSGFVVLVAACQLDWAERPNPVDAGATPTDAGQDVQGPKDAEAPDVVTTTDSGTDCFALVSDIDTKRTNARSCQLASGQCQTTVQDQCGCDVVVAQASSAATATFAQAATNLKNNHPECLAGCPATCPTIVNKNCLQSADGGTLCYQN